MRNKWIGSCVVLAVVVFMPLVWAEGEAELRGKVMEKVSVELAPVGEDLFGGIMRYQVFAAEIKAFDEEHSFGGIQTRVYADEEGEVVSVFTPYTDQPLPYMDGLINPDFRLTEESASELQALLKAIMPENFFRGMEAIEDVEVIREKNGKWQFLTGTFFDNLKGFIVAVDDEGRVIGVEYALGVER